MRNEELEKLKNFLGGTFHQDIDSPEQALVEFINEATEACLIKTLWYCEAFLNSELSIEEKVVIIHDNTEIYFAGIGTTPLNWLKDVIEQMKEAVKLK